MTLISRLSQSTNIFAFALISGTGWTIDFCIFLTLYTHTMLNIVLSNIFSSISALVFVWLVKFMYVKPIRSIRFFCFYLILQAISILFYSLLLDLISHTLRNIEFLESIISIYLSNEALAKIMVTPMNFFSNFYMISIFHKKLNR